MEIVHLAIPGVMQLIPKVIHDERGMFVKTFYEPDLALAGIEGQWPERFYSQSRRGVVRGLHFQVPPSDHAKLVYCVQGTVLDVVLDIRIGSPSYGEAISVPLDDTTWKMLYIPSGLAHGFAALSDGATMAYSTTTVHDPSADAGVHWDSALIDWPFSSPVLSARDAALPKLTEYKSPFKYHQQIND